MFMAVVLDFVFLCFGSKQKHKQYNVYSNKTYMYTLCKRLQYLCYVFDCFCVLPIKKQASSMGLMK